MTIYQGFAHVYGDNIYPAPVADKFDTARAAEFVLADVDPEFATRVKTGDILITGKNFGGELATPFAAELLKAAGIAVVLADSFAPPFVEWAKDAHLPIFVIWDHRTEMEDPVTVDTERGVLINGITGHQAKITPA
jgi:3-isopropylmalate/(R)-2-methylmalate dehydratase small subunit